ncbi:MAG: hypothetical protein AVDCRST_MAG50-941, partial [uncultured Acidimicrobiales bacterium]
CQTTRSRAASRRASRRTCQGCPDHPRPRPARARPIPRCRARRPLPGLRTRLGWT